MTNFLRARTMKSMGIFFCLFILSSFFPPLSAEGGSSTPPSLKSPAKGAIGLSLTPNLQFSFPDYLPFVSKIRWEIARDDEFKSFVAQQEVPWEEETGVWAIPKNQLRSGIRYYWRVGYVSNGASEPDWSETWYFTTEGTSESDGSGGCNAGAAGTILLLAPLALLALKKRH